MYNRKKFVKKVLYFQILIQTITNFSNTKCTAKCDIQQSLTSQFKLHEENCELQFKSKRLVKDATM